MFDGISSLIHVGNQVGNVILIKQRAFSADTVTRGVHGAPTARMRTAGLVEIICESLIHLNLTRGFFS